MRCEKCGGETVIERGIYHYTESGLDNVYLSNLEMRVCKSCGSVTPRIYRMNELHATIGRAVALKDSPLTGAEVRYLRKHLGMKSKEWAALLHADVSTVSRWESGEQKIGPQSDALIRAIYFLTLAEKQGRPVPKSVTDKIAAVVAQAHENKVVLVNSATAVSYVYCSPSEIAA